MPSAKTFSVATLGVTSGPGRRGVEAILNQEAKEAWVQNMKVKYEETGREANTK